MFRTMFYIKNVPVWERVLRVSIGVALTIALFVGQFSSLVITIGIVSIIFIVATGFVGWCPMCALVGRKIKHQNKPKPTKAIER
jgi:hypothetical protein